ncbi:hypothetical protein M0R72_18775 [Candidatus Pacearchaeota archaeon]|jgi:hypothetical protein|nr:hypothetical protein [Candidatus Pacearchaeota archaeon]
MPYKGDLGYTQVQGRILRTDEVRFFRIMEQRGLNVSQMLRLVVSAGLKSEEFDERQQ